MKKDTFIKLKTEDGKTLTIVTKPGADGHTPTKEELVEIIEPLIPDPIPGKNGDNYTLTDSDKKEIASSIEIPVVEKIIEKTETIVEKPIVKEVAIHESADEIASKLKEIKESWFPIESIKGDFNKYIDRRIFTGVSSIKQLSDVDYSGLSQDANGNYILGSGGGGGSGTVTSVDMSVPAGLTISGNPITTSGTLVLGLDIGYVIPLQTTLDGFVPYTGATANVDLGAFDLITNTITSGIATALDISSDTNISVVAPAMQFDASAGSIILRSDGANTGISSNGGSTIAYFDTTSQTLDRTLIIPDADGTIALTSDLASKQDTLVSGTNIKTINGSSILGSGDLVVGGSQTPWTSNINAASYTLFGNSTSGGTLTLGSTSHATKGKILFGTSGYDEVNNRLGIGTSSPSFELHTVGDAYNTGKLYAAITSGNVQFGSTLNTGQVNFSVKQSTNTGLGWIFGYDSFSTNGFYIYTNETTASPNFNIYTGATQRLTIYGTTSMVLNEAGANFDIRMEGDTNVNLFFSDASVDRIGIGHGAPDRLLHVEQADAVTNAVTYPFRVTHTSSGTVATNFGVGQEFEAENASNTNRVIGTHEFIYSDATNATEDATYKLRLIKAGTLTDAVTVDSLGNATFAGVTKTAGYTVATLPTGVAGYRAYVTDALAPAWGVAVAGGGAVTIPVFYDGANWIVA